MTRVFLPLPFAFAFAYSFYEGNQMAVCGFIRPGPECSMAGIGSSIGELPPAFLGFMVRLSTSVFPL